MTTAQSAEHTIDKIRSDTPIEIPRDKPIHLEQDLVAEDAEDDIEIEEAEIAEPASDDAKASAPAEAPGEDADGARRRRRRRRRRGRRDDGGPTVGADAEGESEGVAERPAIGEDVPVEITSAEAAETEIAPLGEDGEEIGASIAVADGEPAPRRRRRGKRGGRRRNRHADGLPEIGEAGQDVPAGQAGDGTDEPLSVEMTADVPSRVAEPAEVAESVETVVEFAMAKPKRRRSRLKAGPIVAAEPPADPTSPPITAEPPAKPKRIRAPSKKMAPAVRPLDIVVATAEPPASTPSAVSSEPAPAAIETAAADTVAPVAPSPTPQALPDEMPMPANEPPSAPSEPTAAPRKGWWNRLLQN